MSQKSFSTLIAGVAVALSLTAVSAFGAMNLDSLKAGNAQLKSAGPLAFGPEGKRLAAHAGEHLLAAKQTAKHSEQTLRANRWAVMRFTAEATRNGSIPMFRRRLMVAGASLVCSVESTI